MTAHTLVLLRHGESDWNAKNLFTGWVDVPLTEKGRDEAVRAGSLLTEAGVLPDVLQDGDLLLMMGAGDIGAMATHLAVEGFKSEGQA